MERPRQHYEMGFVPPNRPFHNHPRRPALGGDARPGHHSHAPNAPGYEPSGMFLQAPPAGHRPEWPFPLHDNPYHPPRRQFYPPSNGTTWPNSLDLSPNPMTYQARLPLPLPLPLPMARQPPYHFPNPYAPGPPAPSRLPPPDFSYAPSLGEHAHKSKVVRPSRPCVICLETFDETGNETNFPYRCIKCSNGHYCKGCLKNWFLDASKDESRMPPKCCSIIGLSVVSGLLSHDEVELYKAKFEEWATPDRLYCPIPQCSAFIPPRLYLEPKKPAPKQPKVPFQDYGKALVFGVIDSPETHLATLKESKPTKPQVSCPICKCSVCTGCRQVTHIGKCPESDLDPALEEQLKKWKIKRCPKCRSGVRKVFGCAHVQCRCGAHFCFECLRAINECDGGCEDGSDEEQTETYEEDDLDGNAGFYEGDGHEFGPEPYGNAIDAWGCRHRWSEIRLHPKFLEFRNLECNLCFKPVHALDVEKELAKNTSEDIVMGGMEWPTNIYGNEAWRCFTGHISCPRCSRYPSQPRESDPSWLWMCDCGYTCKQCDIGQAMEKFNSSRLVVEQQKAREHAVAWECRCGMVVCGGCKEVQPHLR